MRLLSWDDGEFKLEEFRDPPSYAILSHTWGSREEEVTFHNFNTAQDRPGYAKLEFCRDQSERDGLKYFWVDTCCIPKGAGHEEELRRSIRSMYAWYKRAKVCYVYLSDVSKKRRSSDDSWRDDFKKSRWFKRGWTLQELIAPPRVEFYAKDGYLGDRDTLGVLLRSANIDSRALDGKQHPQSLRLSWVEGRETLEEEDLVYCMMGICDVVISVEYGEGRESARDRLEEAIRQKYGSTALKSIKSQKNVVEKLKFASMDTRRSTIKAALARTCKWIFNDKCYTAWLDAESPEHQPFLWIAGKPGSGKSVLMKVIDQETTKRTLPAIHLSFYFNARGEALEKTFLGLYRSLLAQLLEAEPVVAGNIQDIDLSDAHLAISTLQEHIEAVIACTDRTIYTFVDALDECQEEDVQAMIHFFEQVQEAIDTPRLFICLASRHYPIFAITKSLKLTLEDSTEHLKDITKYIDSKWKVAHAIRTEILDRCGGIFLWVVLVVEILQKELREGRVHAISKRLREIPTDLRLLFASILQRDENNVQETVLCIRWILFARRPLSLAEFYYAMMAGIDRTQPQSSGHVSIEQMHAYLISTSKGLAELTRGSTQTTQFIHESVREFLLKEDGLKQLTGPEPNTQSHEILKGCCLHAMRDIGTEPRRIESELSAQFGVNASHRPPKELRSRVRKSICEAYPFFEYAVKFTLAHSNEAVDFAQDLFLFDFDIEEWRVDADLLQERYVDRYIPPLSLTYLCAEQNYANLIDIIADHDRLDMTHCKHRFHFPILAAFANDSKEAALRLLDRIGATDPAAIYQEVVGRSEARKTHYGLGCSSALEWALWKKYPLLSLCLVSSTPDSRLRRCLTSAIRAGYDEVAAELIDRGGFHPEGRQDILSVAVKSKNLDVVTRVLQHGIRVDAAALAAAADQRDRCILHYLLQKAAEYDEADLILKLQSALHLAACNGRPDAVGVLLDEGAEMEDQNAFGNSPLANALIDGHATVAALLVERGAAWPDFTANFKKALASAAEHNLLVLAKWLLDHGADPCPPDSHWMSGQPVVCAASNGHHEMMQLLLEHTEHLPQNVLEYAMHETIFEGHEVTLRLLIDIAAVLSELRVQQVARSAFVFAAQKGRVDLMQMLLKEHIAVDDLDFDGGLALAKAVQESRVEVVRYLLDLGSVPTEQLLQWVASKRSQGEEQANSPSRLVIFELLERQKGAQHSASELPGLNFTEQDSTEEQLAQDPGYKS